MHTATQLWSESGLEVLDIESDTAFAHRNRHAHDLVAQREGLRRLARAFVEAPDTILQQLVDSAVQLCGADSAGISIQKQDGTEENFYHWVATSGIYASFLDAMLPRYPSACGICLERGRPQHFRVGKRFFDIMGIEAPIVADGILLPWHVDGTRGTIFVMSHIRDQAFDQDDLDTMQMLADFAALAVHQQAQRRLLLQQASAAAAADMANVLAHKINNPLQSLTNLLFLATQGHHGEEAKALGQQAAGDLHRLSTLIQELLALPHRASPNSL